MKLIVELIIFPPIVDSADVNTILFRSCNETLTMQRVEWKIGLDPIKDFPFSTFTKQKPINAIRIGFDDFSLFRCDA